MFLQPLLVKGFTKILKKKTMLDHKHLKTNQKKSKHMFILLINKQIGLTNWPASVEALTWREQLGCVLHSIHYHVQ